jgi:hypothetical protein
MTAVYFTIDTEYSAGHFVRHGPAGRADNFARSITGETDAGAVGIGYQMDVFDRHGLRAVFFVDPMPTLIWGIEAIRAVVEPIVARGHDVQLHLHPEWLALAGAANPLGDKIGSNLKDFSEDEQYRLLDYACTTLVAAGAPAPVAFRAGNYGANDASLRALARLGLSYDSSHCPGISHGACAISLTAADQVPVSHCGVIEVPVAAIASRGGGLRHAQLTALSSAEILAAIAHARAGGQASFTLVSHSFELLSRDRSRINQIVKRRFEKLCAGLAGLTGVQTATYRTQPPNADPAGVSALLPARPWRSWPRYAEQALGNLLYGAA